ncbi:MAG: fibronectin type III domain-containing protein, partial [Prevotella sp.]
LKKAFWGENYQACQLQVRLEETSNNIQIIFRDWKPEEDMTSSHSVRIGLRGTDSDYTLLNTDFDDPVLSSESTTAITWKTDSYPADGQTYTFTPPAACQTPAAQPTDLVLKATSTKLIGSFTKTENTDKYLTLISTSSELSEQPADGVLYAVGDNIGNATVLAFDTLNTFATKDILEGSNTYYIKIFSANTFCSYGPIYRLSEPLAAQISTKPTKPGELKVTKSTLNSAVLSAEANTSGDKVVVAMSTLPLYNVYDQLLMGGTFGELPANPSVGDEIEGGGKVIYVGESNDNIVLTDMQENIPYHFRSFSMDAAGTVSTTYSSTDILTGSHLPWIPNTSDFMYWEKSENFSTSTDILSDTVLFANLSSIPEGGNKEYVTTPWLKLDEGSNRIVMDVNFEKFAMWRWSPFNDWTENDTLYFQASIDGETFTDFHKIGKSEAPYIEELNAYVPLRIPFDIYAGKEVKLRIYWNTFDSPRIRMKNIRVEGVKDCDYPIDLKVVEGSIVSDKATIDWTRQGNENAWELRYRVEGSEAWSDILPVESKPYTISGLPGLQNIEVQVRAKCDATTNSDWSENFIFTSSYVVPFTEMFNYTEAPESWEMKSGKLATPTVFDDTNPLWQWYSTWSLKGFFFMNYGSTEIGEWIIGPQVDFGDGSVNYNITFDLIPVEGVTQKDATYSIVLSRDGGQTFNEDDVLAKFTDADFTEDYKAKSLTAKTKGVSGMVRPALYINAPGESMSLQLNSFSIQPTCVNDIDNIVVSDTTDSSVKVSWTTEAENTLIFIRKAGETVKPYEETTEKEKIFTGLDPRTDYEIGLTKSCGAGDTAAVTIVRVTTLAKAACPEVENIKVTPAKYSALIEWTAESSVYNVRYRKINDTEWTQKQVTDTCIVIENLMQDTDYEY